MKIKIPDGMLAVATEGVKKLWDAQPSAWNPSQAKRAIAAAAVNAALEWLAENPAVPTSEQAKELWGAATAKNIYHLSDSEILLIQNACKEWQWKMFLVPEPDPEIKDILWAANPYPNTGAEYRHDEAVKEAYRRGRESNAKPK